MSSNKKATKSNLNENSQVEASASTDSRNNRRSSRIQHTKGFLKTDAPKTPIARKTSRVHSKTHNDDEQCSAKNKNSLQAELENLFEQNDDQESFGSLFEDSFEEEHSKSENTFVTNTYIATSSSLQPEDVSKVLKILSQPNNPSGSSDAKPKHCLKTYGNPRKSTQKKSVAESFGLPDTPILSVTPDYPSIENGLDTEILDASEITILDIKCLNVPWDLTDINQPNFFSDFEEIRVKSDPQKHFKIRHPSGNVEDIQNNDFIFTSTPQIKTTKLPKSNLSSTNASASISSGKKVDINAMKNSIKKLLSEGKTCDISNKRNKNPSRAIHSENVTLDNGEMEIFNTPTVSSRSDKTLSVKTNPLPLLKTNTPQLSDKQEELQVSLERKRNLRSSGKFQFSTPSNSTKKSGVPDESSKYSDNNSRTRHSCSKEEIIDEEVVKILSKPKIDVSEVQTKTKGKPNNVEHPLNIKLKLEDEIISTPRRILRSKSSLDIPMERKSNKKHADIKLPDRNVKSSLGRRLRSMSQENVATAKSFQKNIDFTPKIETNQRKTKNSPAIVKKIAVTPNKTSVEAKEIPSSANFPQLRVVLSPLKQPIVKSPLNQLIVNRSLEETPKRNLNTTRKSLRSYKELPEVSIGSKTIDEKLVATDHSPNKVATSQNTSIVEESVTTENEPVAEHSVSPRHFSTEKSVGVGLETELATDQYLSKKLKKRAPQIFDDGSSSSSESVCVDVNHTQTNTITFPTTTLPEKVDENQVGLFIDVPELEDDENHFPHSQLSKVDGEEKPNPVRVVDCQLTEESMDMSKESGVSSVRQDVCSQAESAEQLNLLQVPVGEALTSSAPGAKETEEFESVQLTEKSKLGSVETSGNLGENDITQDVAGNVTEEKSGISTMAHKSFTENLSEEEGQILINPIPEVTIVDLESCQKVCPDLAAVPPASTEDVEHNEEIKMQTTSNNVEGSHGKCPNDRDEESIVSLAPSQDIEQNRKIENLCTEKSDQLLPSSSESLDLGVKNPQSYTEAVPKCTDPEKEAEMNENSVHTQDLTEVGAEQNEDKINSNIPLIEEIRPTPEIIVNNSVETLIKKTKLCEEKSSGTDKGKAFPTNEADADTRLNFVTKGPEASSVMIPPLKQASENVQNKPIASKLNQKKVFPRDGTGSNMIDVSGTMKRGKSNNSDGSKKEVLGAKNSRVPTLKAAPVTQNKRRKLNRTLKEEDNAYRYKKSHSLLLKGIERPYKLRHRPPKSAMTTKVLVSYSRRFFPRTPRRRPKHITPQENVSELSDTSDQDTSLDESVGETPMSESCLGESVDETPPSSEPMNESCSELTEGQMLKRKRGRPRKVISSEKLPEKERVRLGKVISLKKPPEGVRKRLRKQISSEKPPEEEHESPRKVICPEEPPDKGKPRRRRRVAPRLNGEVPESNSKVQHLEQIGRRKRGRPRKRKILQQSEKSEISREVAQLLQSESTVISNSSLGDDGLENRRAACITPFPISSSGLGRDTPSQTVWVFENVFDSQNTIADHVKKRVREIKSYKISAVSKEPGTDLKSKSFETPAKPKVPFRSWKSLDLSENTAANGLEWLHCPKKTDEVENELTADKVEGIGVSSIEPLKPRLNGDISIPELLKDVDRSSDRSRSSSMARKKPKLDESAKVQEDTFVCDTEALISDKDVDSLNIEASKGSKKFVLRGKSNHNLPLEEPELSKIESEMEKQINVEKKLRQPEEESRVAVKRLPRSKTSLGARLSGHDYAGSSKPRGRPRRISLDQASAVTDEAEKNAKWKRFTIIPSLRLSKKLRQSELETLRDIRGNLLKFKVGNVAWAQIGSFPFWPCLVTRELGTGVFVKTVLTKNVPRTLYHVRFFGDKGRRAWISKHKMLVYSDKDDLEKIYNELKLANRYWPETHYCYVRTNHQKKWTCAVNEAEEIKSKNLKEKLEFFEEAPKTTTQVDKDATETPEPPVRKRMRLSKAEETSESSLGVPDNDRAEKSEETGVKMKTRASKPFEVPSTSNGSDHEVKSPSKKPRRDAEQSVNAPKLEETVSAQETELEDNKIEPPSSPPSECPTPDRLAVKKSEDGSEIESKTSVDSLAIFSSHSLDAQKALFKRNTLFKGVPKEKVCQFCFKGGDVLKCRGGCNGVYHVRCAVKVLREKVPRGRPVSSKSEPVLEVKEIKEESFDVNENNGTAEKDKENLLDDDHVQIITVPSSVYNTPPRKTFPPDFANLSLAEQIDYKMKEIMRKFETQTTYSDSPLDAKNTEETVSGVAPLPRTRNVSRSLLFPPVAKKNFAPPVAQKNCAVVDERMRILPQLWKSPMATTSRCRHVTADSSLDQQSSSEAEKSEDDSMSPPEALVIPESSAQGTKRDSSESSAQEAGRPTSESSAQEARHVTADCSAQEGKEIRHVTADCEALDVMQSENSNSNSSQQSSKQGDASDSVEAAKYVNPKHFKCGFCTDNVDPYCFVCHRAVSQKGSKIRQKCSLYQCGRYYHPECLKQWPQTQWSLIQTTRHRDTQQEIDSFVCPQHVCHTCSSDDPRAATSRCSGDKIVKCLRCPSTYHSTNLCVPAGSDVLSSTQIVCPRHRDKSKAYTINTTWCFLCSEGGALICCETCPTSVHAECMPVNLTDDDKFICEECESGRLPLYDEIVWVKLGKFRWWPALVLFPNEVPPNVRNIKHSRGEFVVKFFGTYDHYWVSRGRSFLFQEGDAGDTAVTLKKKVEEAFNRAVEEAVVVHKLKKEFKLSLESESLNSQKPPPYIKIKVNKPVGNVRQMELDLSNTTACECDPSQPHPCGPDSDCLNRLLMTECNPEVCPAGKRCNNQSFEKREYPPMIPHKTQSRGWGLKSLAPIKKGQFVVEYVGEIIDDEEYQRRIQKMHEQKEENYYFLTIDKDRMIDAGPKGNVARFMNHCCQPNCETQKWTVNGDTRVGLFANQDIPANTELTFNYNLECIGKEKKICRCGAPNCSGFIGVKAKQETEIVKRPKKTYKKKEPVKPQALPPCFICGRKGNVGACNNKICNKAYHLKCLKMAEWPESNKFVCPWHNCKICSKRTIRCCVKCINSYCPSHSEGNIRYDNLLGFICTNHDPSKPQNEQVPVKRNRSSAVITDESAVTSTTSDDLEETEGEEEEGDEDDQPLSQRRKKTTRRMPEGDDSGGGCFDASLSFTSTPLRRAQQDETVSSASASFLEDGVIRKRKRRRSRKSGGQRRKRIRLSNNVQSHHQSTATPRNGSRISRLKDR